MAAIEIILVEFTININRNIYVDSNEISHVDLGALFDSIFDTAVKC